MPETERNIQVEYMQIDFDGENLISQEDTQDAQESAADAAADLVLEEPSDLPDEEGVGLYVEPYWKALSKNPCYLQGRISNAQLFLKEVRRFIFLFLNHLKVKNK